MGIVTRWTDKAWIITNVSLFVETFSIFVFDIFETKFYLSFSNPWGKMDFFISGGI